MSGMDDLRELLRKKTLSIQFERTLGLFSATTIGVGALMGAGVYVLIGLAAEQAGPAVWLSYLLCGALAFLTTLMFADLARLIPRSGGGYAYAYELLGSVGGFITGWFLALGSVFACALYAIGFAQYFSSALGYSLPYLVIKSIAFMLVIGLSWLNIRGGEGGQRMQALLTWGNVAILAVLIIFSAPQASSEHVFPMFPQGVAGVGGAIAIIYISFFGYQLIANNSDEIVDAERTVPRAMILSMLISMVMYLAVALMAVSVVPWQELAASDAPLVLVASQSFGGLGWLIISLGGILASASALNSTIVSQARQLYAMGKDHFFPTMIGTIDAVSKTPRIALLCGGVAVCLALILDLEFIAKSANFCLLVSLLPISVALRRYYRQHPEQLPATPWRRYLPEITLVANSGLLLTLDVESLLFGLQLGAGGAVMFFIYSRRREMRARSSLHVVLSDVKPVHTGMGGGLRVLMPTANPDTQQTLLSVANAIMANRKKGEIVLLSVVKSLAQAEDSLHIVQQGKTLAEQANVPVRPVLRVAQELTQGIVHAAEEESCSMIVMGYGGGDALKSARLMEDILQQAACDVIFCKLKPGAGGVFAPQRVAVAIGGQNNLPLMASIAGAVALAYSASVSLLHIVPPGFSRKEMEHNKSLIHQAMQNLNHHVLFDVQMISSEDPLEALSERSSTYDVLVIGATRARFFERATLGPFSTQLAEKSACSVVVVHQASAADKIIHQI